MGRRRHRQISGRPSRATQRIGKLVRRETVARFDVVARALRIEFFQPMLARGTKHQMVALQDIDVTHAAALLPRTTVQTCMST